MCDCNRPAVTSSCACREAPEFEDELRFRRGARPVGSSRRARRMNRYFARTLGFGRRLPSLARVLGGPISAPGSDAFARTVARWQRRHRMPSADGVLNAVAWRRIAALLSRVGGTLGAAPPAQSRPEPRSAPETQGASVMTMEQRDAAARDAFEEPAAEPADDAEPAQDAGDGAGEDAADELAALAWEGGRRPRSANVALTWSGVTPATTEVDLVIHLHGYAGYVGQRLQLKRDIVPRTGREWDDAPNGTPMAGRSRPTLGILPMGRFFGGTTGRGYHFPGLGTRAGLERLITLALRHLAARTGIAPPRVGRLILTAHSGGGAPLIGLLRHCDPHEIHIFDGLYSNPAPLIAWARRRAQRDVSVHAGSGGTAFMPADGGALRVLYHGRGATCLNSNKVAQSLAEIIPAGSPLAAWYRVEHTTVGHMAIPSALGWRLLQNAAADLPNTSPAAECRRKKPQQGEMEDFLGLSEPLLRGVAAVTRALPGAVGTIGAVASPVFTPWWSRWLQGPVATPTAAPAITARVDPRIAEAVRIARAEYQRWGQGTKHESKDPEMRATLVGYWKTVVSERGAQSAYDNRSAWSAAFISWVMKQAGYTKDEFRFAASHSTYIAAGKAAAAKNDSARFRTYRLNDPAHGRPQVGDLVCRDRSDGGKGCGGTTYDTIVGGSSKTHCDLVVEVASDHIMVIGGNVSGPRCPRDGCTVNIKRVKLDASGFVLERQSPGACKYFAVMKPPGVGGAPVALRSSVQGPTGSMPTIATPTGGANAGTYGTLTSNGPGKTPFRYAFTPEDALWLARMIMGEAGSGSPRDIAGVIWAAFNNYALYWRGKGLSFADFIRRYSTPLQPVLANWRAAKRHLDNPDFIRTGGTYSKNPSIDKGQLRKHLDLQKTQWASMPAAVRTAVESALKGRLSNPGIGNATKWWGTRYLYKKPDCGPKGPSRDRCLYTAWEKFTRNFTSGGTVRWIGHVPRLDQYKYNAFYLENRAANLPAGVVQVRP
jgi:hypothetical protein